MPLTSDAQKAIARARQHSFGPMGDILKLLADAAEIANAATMSISADGQKAVARAKAESFGDDEDVRKLLAAVAEGLAAGGGGGGGGTGGGDTGDPASVITEATTARTLALTDAGDYIRCVNAGTTTITVPTNAAVPFVIGAEIVFRRAGGPLAIANAGVTVNNSALVATVAANGNFALKKVATDTWDAI